MTAVRFRGWLCLLLVCCLPTQLLAQPQPQPLHLYTEEYPPINFSQNGEPAGLATEVVKEIMRRTGQNAPISLVPWARGYQLALTRPNTGLFVTMRTSERERLFKWVGPIGPDDWIMLAKADSKITLETLNDARKYKIGAYKGDAIAETLTKQGLKPMVVLRDQDNAKKLVNGQIDLWATSDPVWRFYAREQGVDDLQTLLSFETSQLYLALNKDTPDEVVERLQAALDQMRSEGYGSCAKNPELC